MKNLKKFFAVLVTIATMFAMSASALAANDVTIPGTGSGDTFDGYKIFNVTKGTGDQYAYTVSDAKYNAAIIAAADELNGSAVAPADVDAALTVLFAEADGTKLAKALAKNLTGIAADASSLAASAAGVVTVPSDGYWVLVPTNTGATSAVVGVTVAGADVITLPTKKEAPTPGKDILDSVGATVTNSTSYVGQELTYRISATLPSAATYGLYNVYGVVLKDTLSAGLDFVSTVNTGTATDIKVMVGSIDVTDDFTLAISGRELTATSANLKTATSSGHTYAAGDTIVITYKVKVNSNAVITNAGNPNSYELSYTRSPESTDITQVTPTPPEVEITFSTKLDVTKTDTDGNPLAGASFKLKNSNGKYLSVNASNEISWVDEDASAATFSSDANGKLSPEIPALADGTYTFTETVTPAGYNSIADFDVAIESKFDSVTGLRTEVEVTCANTSVNIGTQASDGSVPVTVQNTAGQKLPETGGMGTTILYIIGGILVLGAAILLVTRRKVAGER